MSESTNTLSAFERMKDEVSLRNKSSQQIETQMTRLLHSIPLLSLDEAKELRRLLKSEIARLNRRKRFQGLLRFPKYVKLSLKDYIEHLGGQVNDDEDLSKESIDNLTEFELEDEIIIEETFTGSDQDDGDKTPANDQADFLEEEMPQRMAVSM